jgi:hypothetical protein
MRHSSSSIRDQPDALSLGAQNPHEPLPGSELSDSEVTDKTGFSAA